MVLSCICTWASLGEADEASAPGPSLDIPIRLAQGGPRHGSARAPRMMVRCIQGRETLVQGLAHRGLQTHSVGITRHLKLVGNLGPTPDLLIRVALSQDPR